MNATRQTADPETAAITNPEPGTAPGRLKAIWHLEILAGKQALELFEMQNQAIINLLTWAEDHEKATGLNTADGPEISLNDSRGTLELAT